MLPMSSYVVGWPPQHVQQYRSHCSTSQLFSFIIHNWMCKTGAPCLMHFAPNLQNRILACPVCGNGNDTVAKPCHCHTATSATRRCVIPSKNSAPWTSCLHELETESELQCKRQSSTADACAHEEHAPQPAKESKDP